MILAGHKLADRFEIRRRLGSGGMGEVFEAFDRDREELVALKTLARADGDTLTRFKREFRALQSTAHPNLVSLRELIGDGAQWFFTMELVRGRHFLEHVREGGVTDEARLRAALRQLVSGLRALHAAGLVHRDIKPSNVMVTDEGRVVVLDFGLVTNLDPAGQSSVGGPIGTVEYMAPEQAAGRVVAEAADWYGVGVMLYEALTGQVPHTGHALEILLAKQQVEPVAPAALAPDAAPDLCALCLELLRIEPSARPSGNAVARRLGLDVADERRSITLVGSSGAGVFVGRERELAELARAAERAQSRPVVHLVIGESGIGKSELVARCTRRLVEEDATTLTLIGRCYERESVPFKAIDGVADGVAQHLARLGEDELARLLPPQPPLLIRLFPVFQRIGAIASAPVAHEDVGEPQNQRRRMFAAFRLLLAALTVQRRVVVTIDDLQWADADSFLLLNELLRGTSAPCLLVLATVRGGEAEGDAVAARLDALTVHRTALGPLSDDESRVLAERLVPNASARLDVARIAREAGGHPMFLQEILRHLDGPTATPGAPSATLDDALWARVALLRPEARLALEVVCIAGAPLSLETTALACRVDATSVSRSASSLRVAGLAREVQRGRRLALEPYHDRVREAVGGRLDPELRRELHARIAAALEIAGEPRDPQLLLRNFTLGGLPERAARYAEEAAQRSEAAHAFDQAAELWRVALDVIPRDVEDRRRVLRRLGEALINAGRGAEAATHYLAAAEGADRPTRLECHRHAAEQLMISGHIRPGMAALEALLAEIGVTTTTTPRRTLFSLLRHRAQLRLRGLRFKERHRREIADAELLHLDVLKVAAHSLALVDSIRGADFQTRQLLLALRTGYRPAIARALLLESMFQSTNSHPKRAQQLIDRSLAVTDDRGPYMLAMLDGARGMLAYFGGDVVAAVELLGNAETALNQTPGNNWEAATARLFQLFALRFVGDYAALRRKYDQYTVEAAHRGDRYLDSTMRRSCVPMWLAEDDVAGARRDLERATWVPESTGFHVQHFHELVGAGEIAMYGGQLDDAVRLDEMSGQLEGALLLRIESIRVQYFYLRGRLALTGHGGRADVARAARKLGRERNPLAHVWSLLLRAGLAVVAGERAEARALLVEAEVGARRAGMRLTAAAARRRSAELGDGDGDEELGIAASEEMAALGVRAPGRMTDLLIPIRARWTK